METAQTIVDEFPDSSLAECYHAKRMAKPVNFYCVAPDANTVSLVGAFNGWNAHANPMQRQLDGSWKAQVELHHGHHQYLFLVDGEPMVDPNAYGITRNDRDEQVALIAVS